jgi:hypothetical protein
MCTVSTTRRTDGGIEILGAITSRTVATIAVAVVGRGGEPGVVRES